ncbi:MAG: hypothetical protein LBH43_20730 [Treponema sp.]|nr:hypothetical protein [Treponema sp.]
MGKTLTSADGRFEWDENISRIYRKKDVVEKAFMKYKDQLGLKRLHIHTEKRMRNDDTPLQSSGVSSSPEELVSGLIPS